MVADVSNVKAPVPAYSGPRLHFHRTVQLNLFPCWIGTMVISTDFAALHRIGSDTTQMIAAGVCRSSTGIRQSDVPGRL